ncbi:MAG: AAA family ATPase [Saprospiraceae bacterium]
MAESTNIQAIKPFKFRELKIYASTEWLADNKKKYRQVFDRYETSYVYAELSFFNKFFDDKDWDVNIQIKCFSLTRGRRKEVCNLSFKRKVSKFDSVVFIREGWGHKTIGMFWKKGTYYWEAWIESEKEGTKYFYIEDAGEAIVDELNPYIGLNTLKLYEGPYDDVTEDDRIYYSTFSSGETRYIYTEIQLLNQYKDKNWQCELFIKFLNEARELKGQVVRLQNIYKEEPIIKITAGWGSNVTGSWRNGNYSAELVFMDRLIAVVPFKVDEQFELGVNPATIPFGDKKILYNPDDDSASTFEQAMAGMDSLIGLTDVKQQIRDHAKYIQFLRLRQSKGFDEKEKLNVHSVFIGNPGTGKTTVASMMGTLYKKMGLLSKGHVHEVDRVDLVGEYIGQTAPKVKEAIEKAKGGVLFIDEAYALARSNDDSKDFGREVIEILIKEMSNGTGDMVVIVAGYPKEMLHFLNSNPGLKSRFKLFYDFPDYLPDELMQIADFACKEKEVKLSPEAYRKVEDIVLQAYRSRDKSFGNARFVHDIIEKSKINLALRVMSLPQPEQLNDNRLSQIIGEDLDKIEWAKAKKLAKIPIDEKLLLLSLKELNDLIGIQNIKKEIAELVDLVRFYQNNGKDVLNNFFLHTVFIGNPGTGKTTVARILTKVYKALGILERGHMIETDRQGLVAGFVGQTAIKTAEKIDEAMGGVLFVDEAYALSSYQSSGADYGNEAIQTILKRMEDFRGEFFVFVAGYIDQMEAFLKANPGLSSRFDKTLKFDDYQPSDLLKIAEKMIAEKGFKLHKKAAEYLLTYLQFLYMYRDRYFGNARTVRTIVHEIIKNQNLRLSKPIEGAKGKIQQNVIQLEDVSSFKTDSTAFVFNKKGIGFNRK